MFNLSRLIPALVLLIGIVNLQAQDDRNNGDSVRVYELGNEAFILRFLQPDSSILLADEALLLAKELRDTQALVNLWRIKGVVYYGQSQMDEAYQNFEQSYALARQIRFREARILINLGNVFFQQQEYTKALEKFQRALTISESKDTIEWMDALNNIGSTYLNSGHFQLAIDHFQKCLVLQKSTGRQQAQLPTISNIGFAYRKLNAIDSSLYTFQEGVDLATHLENSDWVSHFYERIGKAYSGRGYHLQSIEALQKALSIRDTLGDPTKRAQTLHDLGAVHEFNKDHDLALEYYKRALVIRKETNDIRKQASSITSVGRVLFQKGIYAESQNYFRESIQLYRRSKVSKSIMHPLYNLGNLYEHTNQLDSAIYYLNAAYEIAFGVNNNVIEAQALTGLGKVHQKKGNISQAITFYKRAIREAKEENSRREELAASWLLYAALKVHNKPVEALRYLERHQALQDSLFNEENTKKIVQLEAEYTFEQEKKALAYQNELEKRKLDEKIQRQRMQQWILGLVLSLSLLGLFLFSRFQRFRKQALLKQERLINQVNLQKLKFEQQERVRLQEVDAFKSRFFANISHELRTPLTLILSPIHQLLKKRDWGQEVRIHLLLIQNNANSLLTRVNEILDLIKFDAQQMELQETPTTLYAYSKRLAANFESFAQQKNQVLTFDYQLDKELNILLDQAKFAHVFNNYLFNAIKYTPELGQINISFYEKKDVLQTLVLEVRDNGIGIREEDLPHIFERFYQADQNENKAGGSGIGLALSQEIAHAMQAKVSVRSKRGKGSFFYFEFPYKETMGVVPVLAEEKQLVSTKMVTLEGLLPSSPEEEDRLGILIVEDNKQLREYLQLLLSDAYQVYTAKNGLDALAKLPGLNCQLIISDVMMPMMDGFELLSKLKHSDQYCHLPVIMLTARSEMQDKLKALRIGVDDYLLKPFVEDELLLRISNLLENYQGRLIEKVTNDSVSTLMKTTVSKADLLWLEQLETVLKTEIGNASFTFDQIERKLYISRSQMQRRIKKITGLSPNQYYREIKLQVARRLLESGEVRTVNEVATAIGFETAKYFSKIFAKRFGKRPVEYF